MGVPFLIIDGYNLLHAAGLARLRYGPGDLERARHRLMALLCEKLDVAEQIRCTIVFDARNNPGESLREDRHQELRILFAPSNSDADTVIEDLIAKHSAPRQVILVSADHRLHKAARRRGATPVDSEPFWERLQSRPDVRTALVEHPESAPKSNPSTRKSSTSSEWEAIFGSISVESLAAEVRAENSESVKWTAWQQHLDELQQELDQPGGIDRLVHEKRSAHRPPRG